MRKMITGLCLTLSLVALFSAGFKTLGAGTGQKVQKGGSAAQSINVGAAADAGTVKSGGTEVPSAGAKVGKEGIVTVGTGSTEGFSQNPDSLAPGDPADLNSKVMALIADVEALKIKVNEEKPATVSEIIVSLESVNSSIDELFAGMETVTENTEKHTANLSANDSKLADYKTQLGGYKEELTGFKDEVTRILGELNAIKESDAADKVSNDTKLSELRGELSKLTESSNETLMLKISGVSDKLYAYITENDERYADLTRQIAAINSRLDSLSAGLEASNGRTSELISSLKRGIDAEGLASKISEYAALARERLSELVLPSDSEGKRNALLLYIDSYENELKDSLTESDNLDIGALMRIKSEENVMSKHILDEFYALLNISSMTAVNGRIDDVEEELSDTKEDLESTKEELENTIEDLEDTKEDLENTKDDLENTKEDLENTKETLEETREDLADLAEQTAEKLADIRRELTDAKNELSEDFSRAIEDAKVELSGSLAEAKEEAENKDRELAERLAGLEDRLGITYIKGFTITESDWTPDGAEWYYEIRNTSFTESSHVEVVYAVLPDFNVRYTGDTGYMRIYAGSPKNTYIERIMVYNG